MKYFLLIAFLISTFTLVVTVPSSFTGGSESKVTVTSCSSVGVYVEWHLLYKDGTESWHMEPVKRADLPKDVTYTIPSGASGGTGTCIVSEQDGTASIGTITLTIK